MGLVFLRFVSILFTNIWKDDKQKIWPGFLRFVSNLFYYLKRGISNKLGKVFKDL